MDLRRIEAFIRAAESSSLTEAARQLHISQPAVSHQIKSLEHELDVKLFTRSNTGLKLTEAGQLLLPWARRLMRNTAELKDMMASLQNSVVGDLRISCSSTSGRYVLPVLVARFCKSYPEVRARIFSCGANDAVRHLMGGEAHLGVVSTEVFNGGLESQEFFHDSISLIVPANHPWAARESIEASELLKEPMILREKTAGTRRVMLAEMAKFDIRLEDLNIFLEVGNVEAVLELVAAGYGISFVSDLASYCMRELGCVVKVRVEEMSMTRINYMMRKRIADAHRARDAFWGFVHAAENADLLRRNET